MDVSVRRTYKDGFAPLNAVPPDRRLAEVDLDCGLPWARNELGFRRLHSWQHYYSLRGFPADSIAALLLTFPLTLYYAIVEFGQVPCTAARMLRRPLRIHVVGAEKEINFLDLFMEVIYLLPDDVSLEITFVVREDMLPGALRNSNSHHHHEFKASPDRNLLIYVVAGSYGDSLDPRFDCGSGPPDMLMAFNAGLYAYDSWRGVIRYLNEQKSVLGVFTDYNEMSAVQCASLGGAASRESVRVNPFRQPRAMPVYSMNLPQFSNGFFYVYNQQILE